MALTHLSAEAQGPGQESACTKQPTRVLPLGDPRDRECPGGCKCEGELGTAVL